MSRPILLTLALLAAGPALGKSPCHRYTVAEIDRMRLALNLKAQWTYWNDTCAFAYDQDRAIRLTCEEVDRRIELRLQTYIQAGVRPEELEGKP